MSQFLPPADQRPADPVAPGPCDPDAAVDPPPEPPDSQSPNRPRSFPGPDANGSAPTTASDAALAPPAPAPGRLVAGILIGAAGAALGGWILGEYPFTGIMPYATGVLFALVVGEVMSSISRQTTWLIAGATVIASVGGIGLAVWIQSTEGRFPIPVGGWVAIAIGGVVALAQGWVRMAKRPEANSQSHP